MFNSYVSTLKVALDEGTAPAADGRESSSGSPTGTAPVTIHPGRLEAT